MFYIAEALLNELDLIVSKHGGVHAAFGERYIKTGMLDPKFHRWLLDAFDQRIEGDYAAEVLLVDRDAQELIDHAKSFLLEAERFLGDDAEIE
jgi:uncharacterized protein (UPF0332 family)